MVKNTPKPRLIRIDERDYKLLAIAFEKRRIRGNEFHCQISRPISADVMVLCAQVATMPL